MWFVFSGCLTLLTIFVPASVNAQNTMPADKPGTGRTVTPETKGQKQPQDWTGPINTSQGGAPASSPQGQSPPGMQSAPEGSSRTTAEPDKEEQPTTQSVDKTMEPETTGRDELDSNVTRPRTRDDVIREILSNHSSDKHRPPVLPH